MSLSPPNIPFHGIVWDPEGTSYAIRRVLFLLSQYFGSPLSVKQLDAFQQAVIFTTPMNYSEDITGHPMISYPSGMCVVYDNGIHLDTQEGTNVSSLVFIDVGPSAHLVAAQLSCCQYAWTRPRSFRLFFLDEGLILGHGEILQKPLPVIQGEGIVS